MTRRVPPRPAQVRRENRVAPFHTRSTRLGLALWALGAPKRITDPVSRLERELHRWLP